MANADDLEQLTLDEAAKEFGISRRTLERLRHEGRLPGIRQGRYLRMKRGDVRRALTFSDPIPLYRDLISASGDMPVENWVQGWTRLITRTQPEGPRRRSLLAWIDGVNTRFGPWTLDEVHVGHAVDVAESLELSGGVETLLLALKGLPADRPVISVMRDLVPILNPQVEVGAL